jgi:hypothetical protein
LCDKIKSGKTRKQIVGIKRTKNERKKDTKTKKVVGLRVRNSRKKIKKDIEKSDIEEKISSGSDVGGDKNNESPENNPGNSKQEESDYDPEIESGSGEEFESSGSSIE